MSYDTTSVNSLENRIFHPIQADHMASAAKGCITAIRSALYKSYLYPHSARLSQESVEKYAKYGYTSKYDNR